MSHFTFDAERHIYSVSHGQTSKGHHKRVPSVTQVLDVAGMSPDFSHLDPWYMERGRAIHTAMALELLGELDESSLDERIVRFIEAGRRWLDVMNAEPLVVEHRWVHRVNQYGGTLDLFCDSKVGPLLIDWKATQFDESYAVQVAGGYEPLLLEAAEENAVPIEPSIVRGARCAVVTLGTEMPKTHWIKRGTNRRTFEAALAVVEWRNRWRV